MCCGCGKHVEPDKQSNLNVSKKTCEQQKFEDKPKCSGCCQSCSHFPKMCDSRCS